MDGFEILGVLGRGSYGVAYLAREGAKGPKVAIKVFQPAEDALATLSADDDPRAAALAAFRREAEILGRLDHPGIAGLRAFHDSEERPYIVLKFEEGLNLECALAGAHDSIGEGQLRAILGALLGALAYLHAKQIVHRDIKPANIYLRPDGSPILLDFGAADAGPGLDAPADDTSLLTTGYAAPEQYESAGREGPWTDIYSLAAVAYWMLTGKVPPDARARQSKRAKLVPAVKAAAGRASPELLAALDWGLTLAPERRPQSARDWAEALSTGILPDNTGSEDITPHPATQVPPAVDPATATHDDVPPTQRLKRNKAVPEVAPTQPQRGRVLTPASARPRRSGAASITLVTLLVLALVGGGYGYWQWQIWRNKTEWLVDPAGDGDTVSIADALRRANVGSTIRIEPGVYAENLILDRPVKLEAVSEDPGATVIAPESGACLVATAKTGSLRGLTFRKALGGGGEACLVLSGSSIVISKSVVEADGAPALIARNGGGAALDGLKIAVRGATPAVVISGGAKSRLSGTLITGVPAIGLLVRGGAEPEIIGNEIEGATSAGLMIETGAGGRFEGNQIRNSGATGVVVRSGARPVLAKNRIETSGEAGLGIYDGARGVYDSNVILKSSLSGVVIADGATPLLSSNDIRDNGDHGLLLLKGAGGKIEGNNIQDNKGFGVVQSLESGSDLGKNEISDNKKGKTKKGKIKTR